MQLAAGTYSLAGQIAFNGVSGVTLRGAGPSLTTLHFTGSPPGGNIAIQGGNIYQAIANNVNDGSANWTSGYAQGSSTITLSNVAGLVVGDIITLDQVNDGNDVDGGGWEGCPYCGRAGGTRSQQQYTKVTAISGNSVSISPAIYLPNWRASQTPQAWWIHGYSQRVGVEDLRIDGASSHPGTPYGANVYLSGTWDCWVKNIRSEYAAVSHINPYGGGRTEVRHSYFYGTQSAASMSYGIEPIYSSASLYEDNVFEHVTTPVVLGACTSGNVVAYNFCIDEYYTVSPGWMMDAMLAHDAYDSMNLFEGNYADAIGGDFYHGSSGYNVLFRNRLTGYVAGKTSDTYSIVLWMKSRYWSAVGNVLGTIGFHTDYQAAVGGAYSEKAIFELGYHNNSFPAFSDDLPTVTTFYRHGNYDTVDKSVVWNPSNSDHTLPASLYRKTKPAWFGDRPWPAFDVNDPINATVAGPDPTSIPAGYRFAHGTDPAGASQ